MTFYHFFAFESRRRKRIANSEGLRFLCVLKLALSNNLGLGVIYWMSLCVETKMDIAGSSGMAAEGRMELRTVRDGLDGEVIVGHDGAYTIQVVLRRNATYLEYCVLLYSRAGGRP